MFVALMTEAEQGQKPGQSYPREQKTDLCVSVGGMPGENPQGTVGRSRGALLRV